VLCAVMYVSSGTVFSDAHSYWTNVTSAPLRKGNDAARIVRMMNGAIKQCV